MNTSNCITFAAAALSLLASASPTSAADFFLKDGDRGVVIAGGVPDFLELTKEEIDAKREAALKKRDEKMPELFASIRKSLVIQPHLVEIVRGANP